MGVELSLRRLRLPLDSHASDLLLVGDLLAREWRERFVSESSRSPEH